MTFAALCVAAALLAAQPAPDERTEAVRLARAGSHEDALQRFRDQAARNPEDLEARTWIAYLLVWTGRPAEGERAFRQVLDDDPRAVDALLGLGLLALRQDRPEEALALLERARRLDSGRADTLAALGRAHQIAGRTSAALAWYERAANLAPADADVRRALERTRARHDHRLDTTFVHERFPAGLPAAGTGSIDVNLRASDALRVALHQQVQRKFDLTESRTGAALEWQPARGTRLRGEASVAPGAAVLPRASGGIGIERSARYGDVGGTVRYARFESASVWLAAPGVTLTAGERLLVSARYVLTVTSFDRLGASIINHSAGGSVRARAGERLWIGGGYARGNESFETLSIERIGRFRADTFGGSIRLDRASGASVHAGVECQRSGGRSVWRLMTGVTQHF